MFRNVIETKDRDVKYCYINRNGKTEKVKCSKIDIFEDKRVVEITLKNNLIMTITASDLISYVEEVRNEC